MRIEETVVIAAPADRVWGVIADVERWPEWTASITRIEPLDGPLAPGRRARITQPRLPPAVWTVTEWTAGSGFVWENRSPGVRTVADHRIQSAGPGTCAVRLVLEQTGPLAWLVALLFGGLSRRYVRMEAEGLKRRCEAAEDPVRPGRGPAA